MKKIVFRISGMDCADEVAALKREIGPLVGGEEHLSFDLLRCKMTVSGAAGSADENRICEAVARTGMEAIPWDASVLQTGRQDEHFWKRYGHGLLCATSGFFLFLGFVTHAASSGWGEALVANGDKPGSFPALPILFYLGAIVSGAWSVLPKAFLSLRKLRPDMNLLMTAAVVGAVVLGEWFEAATVSFLFALALVLESWSVGRARQAIRALMDLSPETAPFATEAGGPWVEAEVKEIPVGAIVLVRPGEKIPLDGVVTHGASSVNQSPITGESLPVSKIEGDEVYAGTINNEGAFEFRVTRSADDTTLARIIHRVEEAQAHRAPSEKWIEAFARVYTPAMMLLALLIAVLFPLLFDGEWREWIYEALVILVIACPCALVISTPVSIVAGLHAAARAGVLIKGGAYLEEPARLKVVVLDKTGTLTHGQPQVQKVIPFQGHTREELLARAAALESHSEHPLARAILQKGEAEGVRFQPPEGFRALKGKGAEAEIKGITYWIGSHRLMHEKGLETLEFHQRAEEMENEGHSVIAIGNDRHVCGLISVADGIRDHAASAVKAMKEAGIHKVILLTGDHEVTAAAVARATGIDVYRADLLPENKVSEVEQLVEEFEHVAMVGDGVNDAPAMAAATVGIAMAGAGTDVAVETADIALMSDDLSKLPWLIEHSRRTLRVIRQNVFLALGIKAAVMGLALWGVASLWMAIAADMGASLLVIFNSLRLLHPEKA